MTTTDGPGKETLLFIENDWLVSAPAIEVLRDAGFTVLEARKPSEGFALLEQHPAICLVIADVGLPEMDGNQFVATARAARPDLLALFVTGHDRSALKTPEDDRTKYLGKPYMPEILLREVEALLGR